MKEVFANRKSAPTSCERGNSLAVLTIIQLYASSNGIQQFLCRCGHKTIDLAYTL